jgi:hypothetical protein
VHAAAALDELNKKSILIERIRDKTISGRRAGRWREACFFISELKNALTLTAIPRGFFHTASMLNDLLFACSSKK